MSVFRHSATKKNWLRFALKVGLLGTDGKVLSALDHMLHEHGGASEFLGTRERLSEDLRGHHGRSHFSTLLVGIGIGIGVGMLIAPVSGERARNAIRDRATGIRDRVTNSPWAARADRSMAGARSTGTYPE